MRVQKDVSHKLDRARGNMVRSRVHDEYEWERAGAHEVDEADRMSIQVTIDSRTENPRVGGSIPPLATTSFQPINYLWQAAVFRYESFEGLLSIPDTHIACSIRNKFSIVRIVGVWKRQKASDFEKARRAREELETFRYCACAAEPRFIASAHSEEPRVKLPSSALARLNLNVISCTLVLIMKSQPRMSLVFFRSFTSAMALFCEIQDSALTD